MRILFATYWGVPKEGRLNTYLHLLKKELEQRGHQIDVLAHHPDMQQIYLLSDPQRDAFVKNLNGHSVDKQKIKDVIYNEVYGYYQKYLPHVHPWIRWREIERYTFEMAVSLFNLSHYDLIHTHDIVSTRALWRVKPDQVPLVCQYHGVLADEYLSKGEITKKESLKWKYAAAEEYYGAVSSNHTIVPSKWMQQQMLQKLAVPIEASTIIRYGMDTASFLQWLQYEPYPVVEMRPDTFVISCQASLVPENGHKTLLEALRILKQKRSDFVCWLIGDGKLRGELESDADKKGVADCIIFMRNRFDVPSLLNKTEIVVAPSFVEEQPDAIMKAQMAGKAIVASNNGVTPEMIKEGETGLLFQAENSADLAAKLLDLMNDAGLRRHLATYAKESSVRWTTQALCANVLGLYEQVLKSANIPGQGQRQGQRQGQGTVQTTKIDERSVASAHIGRDSAARYFLFKPNSAFDQKEWHTIAERLPTAYSIPDTDFLRVLTETNQFDE